jgi:hypothetical protein
MTALAVGSLLCAGGCRDIEGGLDASNPARGPGQLVGNGDPINTSGFHGGDDALPVAAEVTPPSGGAIECDDDCRAYCDSLGLQNPVNVGVCSSLWGVGMETQVVDRTEACRRLYVDMLGHYPTPGEVNDVCDQASWGDTVDTLMADPAFTKIQQRRWADLLLYNNRAVSFERAWDMDDLVRKTYEGRVPWDLFAAVTSAHPVLVRRHDNAEDRADALFELFLHRPPYQYERSDMGRLYNLWTNGYWDHPYAGTLPDAYIRYECLDDNDNPNPDLAGPCTSIEWGYNQLILTPDNRAEPDGEQEGTMWSGYLSADEWERLQAPGRVVSTMPTFWEAAVDDVLMQYFGYDLGTEVPEIRHQLVTYLLEYGGDIRSVHYAVATSALYLQSSRGGMSSEYDWTHGPLKQIQVEPWIDSITRGTGYDLSTCDHRLPFPEDYLGEEGQEWTRAMVRNSDWEVDPNGELLTDYRDLARALGGCPTNEVSSRFTTVSILNTALQEVVALNVCGVDPNALGDAVDVADLLPEGMSPNTALTDEVAQEILQRETRLFLGREPTTEEMDAVLVHANECSPQPCTAETFARPVCFVLLSSSEMLFY